MFLKKRKIIFRFLTFIFLGWFLLCIQSYAKDVNVLSWWGYLDSPEVIKELKNKCNANLSVDTYYTNNEFLRRVSSNKINYDIIIFSQTIYDLIKNQIPKNNINLTKFSNKFHPIIRKEYLASHFPPNVIYFMHSLSGFLWNPSVINLNKNDTIEEIFKKANNNIVILMDDPVEISNLIRTTISSQTYQYKSIINLPNFKNLIQNSSVYIANNYNQIYDQHNFAFAFGWTGDTIAYMKQAHKEFEFLIHPKLSYISSDLLATMNDSSETACVANVLMTKKVLDILQNSTYYFSPYGDYKSVPLPIYQSVYEDVFNKLATLKWLDTSITSSDFETMVNAWNEIQLNMQR